jgi:hypothetical protein
VKLHPDVEGGALTEALAADQMVLRKLVANWRALIDQRLAMDEGTLFDRGKGDA